VLLALPSSGRLGRPADSLRQNRLGQCLTLALLLHVWLVLVIGNTPGGSARPGEGVWGSLSVRLRADEAADRSAGPPRPAPPAAPAPNMGAPGKATTERFGGAVRRETDRPAPPTPGAAREGRWSQQPGEQLDGETAALQQPLALLPEPSVLEPVQPLSGLATPPAEPAAPALPALPQAPSLPTQVTSTLPAAPATAIERRDSGRLERASALPPAPPAAAEALARQLPELPPQVTSTLPAAPSTALERVASPALAPVASAASAPAASLQPLPEAPSLPAPREARLDPAAAQAVERLPAAQAQERLRPLAPSTAAASRLPPLPAAPSLLPAVPPPPLIGAPDAGARVGRDVATAPSTPASAVPPKLNLSLPRGGEIAGRESRGVLQLMPHPPEKKTKLQEGIENAARKDCRDAHADQGLVAAVPLVLGAARDKGCRW
jgi:hypothetical protein